MCSTIAGKHQNLWHEIIFPTEPYNVILFVRSMVRAFVDVADSFQLKLEHHKMPRLFQLLHFIKVYK